MKTHYENTKLCVGGITGEIYLAKMLPVTKNRKYPVMSDMRREITKEAVTAVAEHMMHQLSSSKATELTFTFNGIGTLTWKPVESREKT